MAQAWRTTCCGLIFSWMVMMAAPAADGPPPDEALLEFLALWEPRDKDWLDAALAETTEPDEDGETDPDVTETEDDED